MVKVLFVCLGNICRSPSAEGVFRKLVAESDLVHEIVIDSAGTHAYHLNQPPDLRAQQAAARRGVSLSELRGRQATGQDMVEFDYVLAMDKENYTNLMRISEGVDNLSLFLEYSDRYDEDEVPDPYYGGPNGFEHVLDMIEDAAQGLLEDIRRRHSL